MEPKPKTRKDGRGVIYARNISEENILFVKKRCLALNCSIGEYINHLVGEIRQKHETGDKVRGKGRQKNKKLA